MAVDPYQERVDSVVEELVNNYDSTKDFNSQLESVSVNIIERKLGGKAWKDFSKDVLTKMRSKLAKK